MAALRLNLTENPEALLSMLGERLSGQRRFIMLGAAVIMMEAKGKPPSKLYALIDRLWQVQGISCKKCAASKGYTRKGILSALGGHW